MCNNIKELRLKNKMTQHMLAGKVGISRQYLSQLENMKKQPTIGVAYLICEVLNEDIYTVFYPCDNYFN